MDQRGRTARPALVSEGQARRPDRRRLYRRALQPLARIDGRPGASRQSTSTPPPAPDPDCGAEKAGTLEFGTGFDCFDPAQLHGALAAAARCVANRKKTGRSHAGRRLPQLLRANGGISRWKTSRIQSSVSTFPSLPSEPPAAARQYSPQLPAVSASRFTKCAALRQWPDVRDARRHRAKIFPQDGQDRRKIASTGQKRQH